MPVRTGGMSSNVSPSGENRGRLTKLFDHGKALEGLVMKDSTSALPEEL
jgi:hypothetical protein